MSSSPGLKNSDIWGEPILTESNSTTETETSDEVNKRKRVYSFDDFDSEPEENPKLRKFSSVVMKVTTDQTNTKCAPEKSTRAVCECIPNPNPSPTSISTHLTKESDHLKNDGSDQSAAINCRESVVSGEDDCSSSSADTAVKQICSEQKSTSEQMTISQQKQTSEQNLSTDCQRVMYMHSQQLIEKCNKLPRIPDRAGMVHSLIEALGLLAFLDVVPPTPAEEEDVIQFHSRDYIDFLQGINHQQDEEKIDPADAEQYGLTYDCPVQEGVYDCAALVAGATITAAKALCEKKYRTAINWYGGWHHAQRSEASGFCYINDIVLGIMTLRRTFSRIVYIDLDLHHGDGVENAFSTTPHVLTVSFHKYDAGFFPGSGSLQDVGTRGGKYYSVNVPMKDGLVDAQFFAVFRRVMTSVHEMYEPEAVVCQCGADGLAGDPMSSFNLTPTALRHCLYFLIMWKLPLLLLGGGGYHHANTARCWASLTALTVGRKLPQDVPDHKYFTDYGPDYELTVEAGNRKNYNSSHQLAAICSTVTENLKKIKGKL